MNTIKETIIDKIKAGEVHMQPRWHFVLKATLMLVSTILVGLIAVYLLSFVMFALHQSGVSLASEFGLRGLIFVVISSPLLILSLALAFVLLLYVLVTQYAFSYRKPFVYSMLGVTAFVLIISTAIQMTAIHNRVGQFADRHNLPGVAPLYRAFNGERPEGMLVGMVSEVTQDGFLLQIENGESVRVIVTEQTRKRPGVEYMIGEKVVVFGDGNEEVIAFGIRPAPDNFEFRNLQDGGHPRDTQAPPMNRPVDGLEMSPAPR